jgi:hypothetical protein
MDEPAPGLRASDADRERVAFALQTAVSEGRLTLEEFDERVASVYAARTYGELTAVTNDLPPAHELGRTRAPEEWRAARPPAFRTAHPPVHGVGRSAWNAYLYVNVICLIVWACIAVGGGGVQDLWFLWVAAPWGAVLGGREISSRLR